jgi:dienelactone hydrolase
MSDNNQIKIAPDRTLVDNPLDVQLSGFSPEENVTVRATTIDSMGITWKSQGVYKISSSGKVDLNIQAPISGTYNVADPMGLISSMAPTDEVNHNVMFTPPADLSPQTVTIAVLLDSEVIASAQAERLYQADGVKRIVVREQGLYGSLFLPQSGGPYPTITLLSGSGGGLPEHDAALYASHGYAALALAYFNYEKLPKSLVGIPFEYFEETINYLQSRDDIDNGRMAISGRSRGGELSLLLGSIFPQYKAVIADAPSNIVWGSYAEGQKPAWLYKGEPIPYMDVPPDPDIYASRAEYAKRGEAIPLTPGFLETMRRNAATMKKAEIPVEKINGAVLMISGEDDQMWPSTQFATLVMNRLKAYNFNKPFFHLSYPQAGHMIKAPYIPTTIVNMKHPVIGELYALGGKPDANHQAGVDSWREKLKFLNTYL